MTKRLLSLALIALMLAMFIPSTAFAQYYQYVYTDDGKTLNVRSYPGQGDNIIGHLKYGTKIEVIQTMPNGWSTIPWATSPSTVAYVQSRFLVSYQPAPKKSSSSSSSSSKSSSNSAKTVLADMNKEFASAKTVSPYTVVARPSRASGWVNLLWAPTTESERISTCAQGKELIVISELKNWYQVEDPDTGKVGFISRAYTTVK